VNSNIHSSSVGSVRSGIAHARLQLTNVSAGPALFKIQSTAPIHYHVKPSHGRLEAGETKEICCTPKKELPVLMLIN
jgi:hypothetical protein